jgi:hypothetical protein
MAAWPAQTGGGAGALASPPLPTPLPCRREELRWRPDLPAELDSELGEGVDGAGGARETAAARALGSRGRETD